MIGNGRERTKCSCWKTLFTWDGNANPYLISGENERKAMRSLQTVSLQNFSCIEVMEGMISVICFLACSFVWPSERASDRLERILPIWRQNLIWIFIFYFTFRDVRDSVASSDHSFQVSTSQDLGKPIGWQTIYIDAYILCVYLSNTLNRYIYSSNVLLSFFFFHFPITRNDEVLKGLMHILLFISFIYFAYFVFHVDLIPLCSTPAHGMPDGQPFNLSTNFSNS